MWGKFSDGVVRYIGYSLFSFFRATLVSHLILSKGIKGIKQKIVRFQWTIYIRFEQVYANSTQPALARDVEKCGENGTVNQKSSFYIFFFRERKLW